MAAWCIALLSCARADVASPGGIGSGGLPAATIDLPTSMTTSEISPTVTEPPLPTATVPAPSPTITDPEPIASPTFPATPTAASTDGDEPILYDAQTGDTLHNIAIRFGVLPEEIRSPDPLPDPRALIDPGQLMLIPRRLVEIGPSDILIPDSEMVFSPHATDFDVVKFVDERGGFLSEYREIVGGYWRSGGEVVEIVALDNSVNPRLLLALLEYQSGWVLDPERPDAEGFKYPLGHIDSRHQGLQRQLTWAANELGNGYYGWRAGTLVELGLDDRSKVRLSPILNAGSVALQYYFSLFYGADEWPPIVSSDGFLQTYTELFGDPWQYEYQLYEPGVTQPELILPFIPGRTWAFTGGPHGAWERESAWAALDFAPAMSEPGCVLATAWVVASAPGLVVRSGDGIVVIDLDGDGREQSGWALLYLHVDDHQRIPEGSLVNTGDYLGHPSCEGGIATGTHLHIARKYNGEWILADGPMPFNLSGWVAHAGTKPYQGILEKDGQEVIASPFASQVTLISR